MKQSFIVFPHQRKRSKRFDDDASPHTCEIPYIDRHYHDMYFEVTEVTADEVERFRTVAT